MTTPITASFRWSAEELLAGYHLHMRHSQFGKKFRRIFRIWGPGSVVFGIAILVVRDFHPAGWFFVLMGIALLLSPMFSRRILLNHYAKRPDQGMIVTWAFHPDMIESNTDASSSTMEWRMISSIVWAKRGFLLYPNDRIFHWITAHAFRDAGDVQSFAALAKSKVQKFEQVD